MQDFEFFHGAALVRTIHSGRFRTVELFGKSNAAYLIDGRIGLYIKYSRKRMSPWSFTFNEDHVREIKEMNDSLDNIFIALVCNNDGICCLDWKEFCTIISIDSMNYPKWIKAGRKKNEKYSVYGIDGNLEHKIGNSDFPNKLKTNEYAN